MTSVREDESPKFFDLNRKSPFFFIRPIQESKNYIITDYYSSYKTLTVFSIKKITLFLCSSESRSIFVTISIKSMKYVSYL